MNVQLQRDDVPQEITRFMREEPLLTIRELARRLGNAEEGCQQPP